AVTAAVAIVLLAANTIRSRAARGTAVALLALASIELVLMSMHSIPQQLRTDIAFTDLGTATTEFLADVDAGFTIALTDDGRTADYEVPGFRPNANALADAASIDGYDGGVQITKRWADSLRRFQPDPPIELPLRNSLTLPIEPEQLARLGVRYILLDRARPPEAFIPGWTGPVATDDLFEVWENPAWLGDAVAWSSAEYAEDPAERLRTDGTSLATSALVTDRAAVLECDVECDPVGVEARRPRPERIEATVDLDRPTVVSVAQQALPGWTVTVDGRDAEVVEVDGILLGVSVPAGQHEVVFSYHSPWLTVTLALSVLAMAATIALLVGDMVLRRRTQAAGGGDR
ncbi:MAG: YfhO family protein, partial [Acidobacteriota bacterium]